MQNIAVIYGGKSLEHDISIITGFGVLKNISSGYNVYPVFIDKNGDWWTGEVLFDADYYTQSKKAKPCFIEVNKPNLCVKSAIGYKRIHIDCVVLCVHGDIYEGGAIQGLLDLSKIPYTSPDMVSSAIFMDKALTKQWLKALNINTAKYITIHKNTREDLYKLVQKLSMPLIVKPASAGSSIGVSMVNDEDELAGAVADAFLYDKKVIVEECLCGARELNVALFRDGDKIEISAIEEVVKVGDIYSFGDKYQSNKAKRIIPANIPIRAMDKLLKVATQIYDSLDMQGLVRVDAFLKEDKIFINEVNTIPGSLGFYLFKPEGISYTRLLDSLIKNAIANANRKDVKLDYESDVLDNLGGITRIREK